MKKQVHVYFSGEVQGIGFRYTAEDMARSFSVCGWVKNLSDGRVEILAEGPEEALKGFLDRITRHFSANIAQSDVKWLSATGEWKDFRIAF